MDPSRPPPPHHSLSLSLYLSISLSLSRSLALLSELSELFTWYARMTIRTWRSCRTYLEEET